MEDQSEKTLNSPKFTRRDFLKLVGLGTAGVVLPSLLTSEAERSRGITNENISQKIPDILTEEKLKESNINIYNTPGVKLYVREEAFEFPLFRDLKEGKVDGLHLVLVDHHNLTWKTTEQMEEIPREFLQAFLETPKDWSEDMWFTTIENTKIDMMDHRDRADYYREKEKWYVDTQTSMGMSLTDEFFLSLLESNREMYDTYNKLAKESEHRFHILTYDREVAIDFLMEDDFKNGLVAGFYWDGKYWSDALEEGNLSEVQIKRATELFSKYPNLKNEVLIYLAVGGVQKPMLSDSVVNPETDFSLSTCFLDYLQDRNANCYPVQHDSTGFVLRHELFHYNTQDRKEHTPEARTDWLAYKSFQASWEAHKKGGDPKAYPFVFMTDEGLILTHEPEEPKLT